MPSLARYAALLRGVSPLNAKMPALKEAFEVAGFSDVKTVLSSGNVVFSAKPASVSALAARAEAAMTKHLGKSFLTFVEPVADLAALIEQDPWSAWKIPPAAKRVVTFLKSPPKKAAAWPLRQDGAAIYDVQDHRVFSAYVVGDKGPVFMVLLEKTFGKEITTRTWDTVKKLAR
jgi:uncharacterized protein (DUF1697 family)